MINGNRLKSAQDSLRRKISTPRFYFFNFAFLLFTFYFLLTIPVQAQIDEPPADAAPPPVYIIPKDEQKSLEEATDLKKHTQLSLELLNNHLAKAEQLVVQNNFQNALSELGNYQAILVSILRFLNRRDDGGGKVKDNFKRLEIGLRPAISRLEVVRRGMPYNYGYYVRELQKVVRDARAQALEPLFDDNVVKQKDNE